MKISKKLFVAVLAAILAVISIVPSTFSWYTHNKSNNGKKINYSGDIPISIQSSSGTISMVTYESDANGTQSQTTANGIDLACDSTTHRAIKYYKSVLTNIGANAVYADIMTSNMANNADFVIGTTSPTINEKAYASRPVRNKVSDNKVRVYFKTHSSMSAYWSQDKWNEILVNEQGTYAINANDELTNTQYTDANNKAGSDFQSNNNSGTLNDTNISFKVGGKEYQAKLKKCSLTDNENLGGTGTNFVFYYDLPSNTDSFFFFNHWYLRSSSNREWNRTIDITDLTQGRLYYLTGAQVDGKYKEYAAREVDTSLVALNQYYTSVRMSQGENVSADIGLKKESDNDDVEFIPEYYGASISYTSSNTNVVSVNKDGVLVPASNPSSTTATITTTITGKFGDTRSVQTSVEIPAIVNQVPIIKNVKVPAGGTVNVDWYVINKSSTANMPSSSNSGTTASSIFFSI